MIDTTTKKRSRHRNRGRSNAVTSQPQNSNITSGSVSESDESNSSSNPQKRITQRKKNSTPRKSNSELLLSTKEQAQYVAIDCEMVGVGPYGGVTSTLARVTMVNWNGDVVYDQFIRPNVPVTDYRTFVSGITAADLEIETVVDFETCRSAVLELLSGKTVIGHALKNDLQVLRIQHPWQRTRDTAKYEPFMKQRFDDGVLWPRKLKELVWEHMQIEIQPSGQPHSPIEDAVSALSLYKSVRTKWEKVMQYKIQKTASIEQQKQPPQTPAKWPTLVPSTAMVV